MAGRYRLAEHLGSGGMGSVWAGRDELLRRDVALKEVWQQGPPGKERWALVERTRREARAAAAVSSPSVMTVYDVVEEGERTWIVMERLPPRTLADRIAEEGPLEPADVAAIGLAVLDALDAAHEVGVLHRDVKPGNVMWSARGRVVLADFGIAQAPGDTSMTQSGMVLGSPAYLSPERARGEPARPDSDLWALGALLFAALEGRAPFGGSGALATVTSVVVDPVPPAPHAGPLAAVVQGLLTKDPAERMTSAQARPHLVRALRRSPDPTLVGPLPDRARAAAAALPQAPPAGEVAGASEAAAPHAAPAAASQTTEPAAVVSAPAPRLPERSSEPPGGSPSVGPSGQAPAAEPRVSAPVEPDGPARRRPRRLAVVLTATVLGILLVTVVVATQLGSSGPRTPAASGTPEATASAGALTPAASTPAASTPAPSAGSSEPPAASATASDQQPASPTPQPGTATAAPEGLQPYTDPTGFTVAVPAGWQPETDGSQVRFRDPGSSRYLLVDQTTDPAPDALKDWEEYEPSVRKKFRGYERVRLERIQVTGMKDAADLEFTFDGGAGRTHVVDRNLLVDGSRAYALYWSAPDASWPEQQRLFEAVAGTFRPAQ